MSRAWNWGVACGVWLSVACIGCVPQLPDNTAVEPPERSVLAEADGIVFSAEPELDGAVWADITRPDGSGTVGGYLSQNFPTRKAIVVLLHGASTFMAGGGTAAARVFHETTGRPYREAGYLTFSLDFRECGTPYGQGDLEDLIQVIDWLNTKGSHVLGVNHVCLLGYSVGATSAMLANRQREVAAVAAISGATGPEQFERSWQAYNLAAQLYSHNAGFCQLGTTLAAYGPPGSPAWEVLNIVGQIHEMKNPLIVVQGDADQIYSISNSYHLEAAYVSSLSSGVSLPEVQFLYLPGQDHFSVLNDPETVQAILALFNRFDGSG